jgi:hypothetical protein
MAMHELQDKDVQFKLLARMLPLLDRLHDAGTQRDTAGNRRLFYDDYVKLVVLYLTTPMIESISGLQRAAQLPRLARQLGVQDFSKASFSEAPAVFEPQALVRVIQELAGELQRLPRDPRLADIRHAITLVDGTLIQALPRLVETLYNSRRRGLKQARGSGQEALDNGAYHAWRVHTLLDLDTLVPQRVRLTGGSPRGANNERRVLEALVEPGRLYVADRGYFDKSLMNRIVKAASLYVFRAIDDVRYQVLKEHTLSAQAIKEGVIRDCLVQLEGLEHPTRLVAVRVPVHAKRTRKGYVPSSGQMMFLCPDLDLAAELISLLYRYRWTIETYFKFIKQLLGCRHLLSQRKTGVEIQIYCAVIVCMLLNLSTGLKPAKAVMELIAWYLLGFADVQDVQRQIDKTRREQEARAKKRAC